LRAKKKRGRGIKGRPGGKMPRRSWGDATKILPSIPEAFCKAKGGKNPGSTRKKR